MYKIYKQMFHNKIIQIIAIIWLMKQQQLVFCVAGRKTQTATTVTLITTSQQQQLENIKNLTKPLIKTNEKENYSSESNNNNNRNTTITSSSNITSNKLNVNNTDTQMTLKLKDATARNACVTHYLKYLTLPAPATELNNDESSITIYNQKREPLTSFQILKGKPSAATDTTRSFENTTKIFLGGQLVQNLLRSPPETTVSYLHNKRTPIIKGTTLQPTEENKLKEAAPSSRKQNNTATNNLKRNNNLINKTDLNLQQQLREINKGLYSRILKDKQVNYVERKAVKGLIEKGIFLQTANEGSRAAEATTTKEQEKQIMMTKGDKIKQRFLKEKKFRKLQIYKINCIEEKQKKNNTDGEIKNQFSLQSTEQIILNKTENSNDINNLSTKAFAESKLSPRALVLRQPSKSTKAFLKNELSLKIQQKISKANNKKALKEMFIKNDKAKKLQSFQSKAFEAANSTKIQAHFSKEKIIKLSLQQKTEVEEISRELKQAEIKFNELKLLQKNVREDNSKQYDVQQIAENISITNEYNKHNDKPKIPFTANFRRQKRLNKSNLGQSNPLQFTLQKSQNENSTEIYYPLLAEKKSANLNSFIFNQNNEIKTPIKTDEQSVARGKKMPIKFENKSVEMETENVRKLNLNNNQEELALNKKVSGSENSMMPKNNTMNYNQLKGSLNKNIDFIDNGKQIETEINAYSVKEAKNSVQNKLPKALREEKITATTNEFLLTSPMTDNVSPTAVTQQNLLDFQTPKANAWPSLIQSRQALSVNQNKLQSTTTQPFSTDFINLELNPIDREIKTSTMQLISTTSTTTSTESSYSQEAIIFPLPLPSTIDPTKNAIAGFLNSSLATTTSTTAAPSWPVKHASVMEGDVILGGLMMVHSREDSITCGPIMPQGGIQALEAMLYTLDQVNKQKLLPNITLGAHILDDCDKDTYGLEMAVDFIKVLTKTRLENDVITSKALAEHPKYTASDDGYYRKL